MDKNHESSTEYPIPVDGIYEPRSLGAQALFPIQASGGGPVCNKRAAVCLCSSARLAEPQSALINPPFNPFYLRLIGNG